MGILCAVLGGVISEWTSTEMMFEQRPREDEAACWEVACGASFKKRQWCTGSSSHSF